MFLLVGLMFIVSIYAFFVVLGSILSYDGCGCISLVALVLFFIAIFVLPPLGIPGFFITMLALWLVRDRD